MNRRSERALALLISSFCAAASSAMTVEEAIAKHIEARGGVEAWKAIDSMKTTGNYTAFSKVSPFTLLQQKDSNYYMDVVLDDKRVITGYDGKDAWWDNAWRGEGIKRVTGPDLQVLMQNVEFATPFFGYEERGFGVKLLGEAKFEGESGIAIELTRPDESVETWYLSPETYLEFGREASGSDFGRPMPQKTFYDDFREVAGVMVPHYVEGQWYTRQRIMEIDKVEVGLEVDESMFAMPAPMGMADVLPMVGEWSVAIEQRQGPSQPWSPSTGTAAITTRLDRAILDEEFVGEDGRWIQTLSYDRYRERHVVTSISDFTNHQDIAYGGFEDGRLTVSNVESDTSWTGFGSTFHQRSSFFDITEGGFKVEQETSVDGGENWFVAVKMTYTPNTPTSEELAEAGE